MAAFFERQVAIALALTLASGVAPAQVDGAIRPGPEGPLAPTNALPLQAFAATLDRALLPCDGVGQMAPVVPLDLPRLVVAGLCNRQLADIQRAEIDARRAQVGEARAGFYPTGQLSAGRSATQTRYFGEVGLTDRQARDTAGLMLNWRLFDFGARAAGVDAARGDEAMAAASAAHAVLAFARQLVEAHHEVHSLQLAIAARERETPWLTQRAAAQDRLAAHVLPPGADLHGPRLRLAEHLAQLDADRARLHKASAVLAGLAGVGRDAIAPASTPAAPAAVDPLEPWLERAAAEHPAVRAARFAREAAGLRAQQSARARYPAVDLTAARYLNRSGSAALLGNRAVVDEYGVQLSWTFFDGFAGASRTAGAGAAAAKASHQLTDTLDEVSAAVRASHAEWQALVEAWRSAKARSDEAERARVQTDRRLAAGQATLIDRLEAELAVSAARRELTLMAASCELARHRLALEAGSLAMLDAALQASPAIREPR